MLEMVEHAMKEIIIIIIINFSTISTKNPCEKNHK